MKYIPLLIPEHARVLPHYFKPQPTMVTGGGKISKGLQWALGLFFGMLAIMSLIHPLLSLLWLLCGFIAFPPGHRFLERRLRFRLTTAIKAVTLLLLFTGSFPLILHYAEKDKQAAERQQLIDDRVAKEQAVIARQDAQRQDTLASYLQEGRQLGQSRQWEAAKQQLQRALTYARNDEEKNKIRDAASGLQVNRSQELVKAGKYKAALPLLDSALAGRRTDPQLRYNRALCYSKTGRIADAVSDLRALMQDGNKDAEKLHDKINPLRKRIVGYETLCCDGSTSGARGRGACSHHGGVCDWNHPIYEEYRKYE
ncbi:tetratricopeptide repeat protein [Taibaiella koreensis]|uniref:tetratricopeptide repeat protein n=1 Tax=Taibaiella koreensis TaxID=1268548 RepID=UPI0013C2DCC8|nr:tetratricopeptide repeat protein [Taibaiella koreensis]